MDSIIVAFSNDNNRNRIAEILESGNHIPRKLCRSGKEAIRTVRELGRGIVVCGYKLTDMTADDLAYDIGDIGRVLVIATPTMLDMCENTSICKIPTPLKRSELLSSVEMLIDLNVSKAASVKSQRSDEEKEIILKAKAILMEKRSMTEPEAHRYMQKRSMDSGFKLISTARLILSAYAAKAD